MKAFYIIWGAIFKYIRILGANLAPFYLLLKINKTIDFYKDNKHKEHY